MIVSLCVRMWACMCVCMCVHLDVYKYMYINSACISVSMYTYSDTHACITVLEITVDHWLFSNLQHLADQSATVTVHFQ